MDENAQLRKPAGRTLMGRELHHEQILWEIDSQETALVIGTFLTRMAGDKVGRLTSHHFIHFLSFEMAVMLVNCLGIASLIRIPAMGFFISPFSMRKLASLGTVENAPALGS